MLREQMCMDYQRLSLGHIEYSPMINVMWGSSCSISVLVDLFYPSTNVETFPINYLGRSETLYKCIFLFYVCQQAWAWPV